MAKVDDISCQDVKGFNKDGAPSVGNPAMTLSFAPVESPRFEIELVKRVFKPTLVGTKKQKRAKTATSNFSVKYIYQLINNGRPSRDCNIYDGNFDPFVDQLRKEIESLDSSENLEAKVHFLKKVSEVEIEKHSELPNHSFVNSEIWYTRTKGGFFIGDFLMHQPNEARSAQPEQTQ
ncbi:MAG: hypothetical protein AABZ55_04800 [Bdellovibrionota bacterium]